MNEVESGERRRWRERPEVGTMQNFAALVKDLDFQSGCSGKILDSFKLGNNII